MIFSCIQGGFLLSEVVGYCLKDPAVESGFVSLLPCLPPYSYVHLKNRKEYYLTDDEMELFRKAWIGYVLSASSRSFFERLTQQ